MTVACADEAALPPHCVMWQGALDVNAQQIDLRAKHSWNMPLGDVHTVEAAEVPLSGAPLVLRCS